MGRDGPAIEKVFVWKNGPINQELITKGNRLSHGLFVGPGWLGGKAGASLGPPIVWAQLQRIETKQSSIRDCLSE